MQNLIRKATIVIIAAVCFTISAGCSAQAMKGIAEIIHGVPPSDAQVTAKAAERVAIANIMVSIAQDTINCTTGCTISRSNPLALQQMVKALEEPTEGGFWSGVRDVANTLITTTGGVINANAGIAAVGYVGIEGFKALKDSGGEHNTIQGSGTIGGGTYNPQTATPTVVDTQVVIVDPEVVIVPPTIVDPVIVDPIIVPPTIIDPVIVTPVSGQ